MKKVMKLTPCMLTKLINTFLETKNKMENMTKVEMEPGFYLNRMVP